MFSGMTRLITIRVPLKKTGTKRTLASRNNVKIIVADNAIHLVLYVHYKHMYKVSSEYSGFIRPYILCGNERSDWRKNITLFYGGWKNNNNASPFVIHSIHRSE